MTSAQTAIEPGSLWQRKRGSEGHHAAIVRVTKTTVNNVYYVEEREPKVYTRSVRAFLSVFEPLERAEQRGGLPMCKRCGDYPVDRLGYKLCHYCAKDVEWRTVKRKEEEDGPCRTIQAPIRFVEEEQEDVMPQQPVSKPMRRWLISGRIWEEKTFDIDATDLADIQAKVAAKWPTLDITGIALDDDTNGNGHT